MFCVVLPALPFQPQCAFRGLRCNPGDTHWVTYTKMETDISLPDLEEPNDSLPQIGAAAAARAQAIARLRLKINEARRELFTLWILMFDRGKTLSIKRRPRRQRRRQVPGKCNPQSRSPHSSGRLQAAHCKTAQAAVR